MKLYLKSFNGDEIVTIKCKQTDSIYDVIVTARQFDPTIFTLISLLPTYRTLSQLNSLYTEFIYKNHTLYIIFDHQLPDIITKIQNKQITMYNLSDKYKNDKQVVLQAVTKYGWGLGFASKELRNDPDVLAVVNQ